MKIVFPLTLVVTICVCAVMTISAWEKENRFTSGQYNLKPKTTYYYTVDSMESNGKSDGVTSPVQNFTTP